MYLSIEILKHYCKLLWIRESVKCHKCKIRTLQRIVRTAEKISWVSIPTTDYNRCIHKSTSVFWTASPNPLMETSYSCHLEEGIRLSMPPPPDSATDSSLRQSEYRVSKKNVLLPLDIAATLFFNSSDFLHWFCHTTWLCCLV